ncbi:hypothetical protein [Archaeoglobus sp.]
MATDDYTGQYSEVVKVGDLILKISDKTMHATMVGDPHELVVLDKDSGRVRVYFNKAEIDLEKVLKKLLG